MLSRLLAFVWLVSCGAGGIPAAPALVSVSAGWPAQGGQGVVKAGCPFPMRATVRLNGRDDSRGCSLVVESRDPAGNPCETSFSLEGLGDGTHTVPLLARHTGSWLQPLRVILRQADGSVAGSWDIAPSAMKSLAPHQPVVLAMGAKFPELERILGRLDRQAATGATDQADSRDAEPYPGMVLVDQPDILPVDPSGFLGVDMAIVSLSDAFMSAWMAPAQSRRREALGCWLADGGRLVVGVEQGNQANLAAFGKSLQLGVKWPAEAAKSQESRRVPVSSLPRWVAGNLPPLAARPVTSLEATLGSGEILAREPSPGRGPRPILVQGGAGRGWVLICAVALEPSEETARQEKEIWRGFWGKVLADGGLPAARSSGSAFLDNLADTGVSVVPFGWVVLIILALGALFGPIDYLLADRLARRPAATWLSFPVLAIASTAAILAATRLTRGDKPVERWFTLVDLDTRRECPRAWGEVMLARVDPHGSRHDVAMSPAASWFETEAWRSGPVGPVTVEDRPRPMPPLATRAVSSQAPDLGSVNGLLCPPGGEQVLAGRFSAKLVKSPLVSSLRPSRTAPHLHGSIENHLPIDLTDVVLLHAGRMQALGDLPGRGGRVLVETIRLGDAGEASETWRVLMHQGAGVVEGGRVIGGREQARPALPAAFQPFLFARPEASDAARAMGLGWDQSWRLRRIEDSWRDEVVLVGRAAFSPANLTLDGVPATADPERGAVLVRAFLPVDRTVEPTE
ncbi:MAG: hypothetical protein KJS91_09540 [Planctomycetes bacterium]|nr:hypothetical protein [Planctomycetota bacterium]